MSDRAGYVSFIRNVMGIPVSVLPDNSAYIDASLALAIEIVPGHLAQISALLGDDATYNLAGHTLIEISQDLPGATFLGYIAGVNLTITTLLTGSVSAQQSVFGIGVQGETSVIEGAALAWIINKSQNIGNVNSPVSMNSKLLYFSSLRAQWKMNMFIPGVLNSTSDEGTSSSYTIPEFMEKFTMADLQYMKTPYGRQYMAYAQRLGYPMGIS